MQKYGKICNFAIIIEKRRQRIMGGLRELGGLKVMRGLRELGGPGELRKL